MSIDPEKIKYVPGTYTKKRPNIAQHADRFIRQWEETEMKKKAWTAKDSKMPPTICISRKIGVGALEIAELVAEKIGYRVADRLIMEKIAGDGELSKKAVKYFDERYPGKMAEFGALLFGEKSFIMGDYTRKLFSTVFALAESDPTVFIGRGAHLILPRDSVMAVRCISSKGFRIKRVADILNIEKGAAEKKLDDADKEQREFFKKVYAKKDASPEEFDLIINCDFIGDPSKVAEIVCQAFMVKFPTVADSIPGKKKEVA